MCGLVLSTSSKPVLCRTLKGPTSALTTMVSSMIIMKVHHFQLFWYASLDRNTLGPLCNTQTTPHVIRHFHSCNLILWHRYEVSILTIVFMLSLSFLIPLKVEGLYLRSETHHFSRVQQVFFFSTFIVITTPILQVLLYWKLLITQIGSSTSMVEGKKRNIV